MKGTGVTVNKSAKSSIWRTTRFRELLLQVGKDVFHMKTPLSRTLLAASTLLFATASAFAHPYKCTSAIVSNFNGTAIRAGDVVWFNAVLKLQGLSSNQARVFVTHASISFTANGTNYNLVVPPSQIAFSSATTLATPQFTVLSKEIGSPLGWKTNLQSSGLAGNDFLGALSFSVPASGLPGGIKNVIWQVTFSSDTAGLTVNWQWGAAVYTAFGINYNDLGVKPVDDNKGSQYQNSDHAGTPENFKADVTGGASGGGGSNFTGSYSGTGSCALVLTPSTSLTVGQ